MLEARYEFSVPTHPALRWLADPGYDVSQQIRSMLLGELFSSPNAVIAGLVNGLILNIVALCLDGGIIFAFFTVIDVVLVSVRIAVVRRAVKAAAEGRATPTDQYLITAGSWCALQGAMAFAAMRTGIVPLQILSATTMMGLIGPICARNYAAPRYAMMLVGFCDLPFVVGAALTGDRWLLILALQTPLFLFGVITIIRRFQGLAIANLQAEQDSLHRARHDFLTGLLNRFGLMEALGTHYATCPRFIMFYLDLDGFKQINDAFGHQAGDEILRAVADRLRLSIPADTIVSRLGGDEFVIVAPNMSPAAGTNLADDIIHRISDEPYLLDAIGPLRIGISIGFACVPDDAMGDDDLHRKADAALYAAKAAGRGTHRRFSTPMLHDKCAAAT